MYSIAVFLDLEIKPFPPPLKRKRKRKRHDQPAWFHNPPASVELKTIQPLLHTPHPVFLLFQEMII
jgi:hypothetical protein